MKAIFCTLALAACLSLSANNDKQETVVLNIKPLPQPVLTAPVFSFGNALFTPTIDLEGEFNRLPLDADGPFQHTLRGAIYTYDFLTHMPR